MDKLLGIGEEAIGHMERVADAAREDRILILKQSLEVVTQTSLPAGGLYGMPSESWAGHHQRRRLVIEWDEVLPS